MKKRKFKKPKKLTQQQLQKNIYYLLSKNPKKRFHPRQIAKKLGINNSPDSINDALKALARDGKITNQGDYKFQMKNRRSFGNRGTAIGRVDSTRTGAAYIEIENRENDIFVAPQNVATAMNGDLVEIKYWIPKGRRKPEGEVVRVIERAADSFVGTLHIHKLNAYVLPTRIDANIETVSYTHLTLPTILLV